MNATNATFQQDIIKLWAGFNASTCSPTDNCMTIQKQEMDLVATATLQCLANNASANATMTSEAKAIVSALATAFELLINAPAGTLEQLQYFEKTVAPHCIQGPEPFCSSNTEGHSSESGHNEGTGSEHMMVARK